jgi:hypothetical protein
MKVIFFYIFSISPIFQKANNNRLEQFNPAINGFLNKSQNLDAKLNKKKLNSKFTM